MKYCIFSDIHGNFINLVETYNSTLNLKIDKYFCLGDLCNYYPDNKKVIDFLIENNIECIIGNHDELYLKKIKLSRNKLKAYNYDSKLRFSSRHINFLSKLSDHIILGGQKKILLCHGSPNDFLHEYIYPDTDLSSFESCGFDIIFFGHTHRQFLQLHKGIQFCNVGSIGLPRDNGSLIGFATYDTETNIICLYRKNADILKLLNTYSSSVPKEVIELLNRKEKIEFPYILIK